MGLLSRDRGRSLTLDYYYCFGGIQTIGKSEAKSGGSAK